ncbi:unnamed protein product [Moneuplotes crassus]|uniref:Uncharacterized protein n=1 Tax=Euplotes crassus TaxID=5936 RepID=A0AAD2D334_EUPCR|nr:unnamed protein product [Moneuplotes crassus]
MKIVKAMVSHKTFPPLEFINSFSFPIVWFIIVSLLPKPSSRSFIKLSSSFKVDVILFDSFLIEEILCARTPIWALLSFCICFSTKVSPSDEDGLGLLTALPLAFLIIFDRC